MEQDVRIRVPGGPVLEARLGLAEHERGGLVICHPHPLYGGDMDNPVMVRAAEVGAESGLSTLRFNFRGVGSSTGQHAEGRGERDDLEAALRMLLSHLPEGGPLGVAGYSFGAWIAAQATGFAIPMAGICLIAPPLSFLDFGAIDGAGTDILVVAGTRDPYCPPDKLATLAERLPDARVQMVEDADHFFFGKLFPLGEAIRTWACRWARG